MQAACRKGVKMPKGSPELTQARREEIINACEKLYEVMSFKEVTIKEISKYTSFTRPSIQLFQHERRYFSGLITARIRSVDSLSGSGKADVRRKDSVRFCRHVG